MAFLCKEKRFKIINKQDDSLVGPGQYLPQTTTRLIKQNFAPFGTRYNKFQKSGSNSPGPGSYITDEWEHKVEELNKQDRFYSEINKRRRISMNHNSINLDTIIKSQNSTINDKVKRIKDNLEVTGFSIQEKRFKNDAIKNDLPGPGFYYPETDSKLKTKRKIRNLKIDNFKIIGSATSISQKVSSISTIPSKDNQYGYDLSNGNIKPRENPDMYKTFSGEKWDMVGPGNYDISLPEEWHKTGTEWSKYKQKRIMPPLRNRKKEIKEKIIKSIEKEKKAFGYNTLGFAERQKIRQQSLLHRYNISFEPFPNKMKDKGYVDIHFKMTKDFPGPGYYYEEKYWSAFNTEKKPNKYKVDFENSKERFYSKANSYSLAPNIYFKDDPNHIKQLKNKFSIEATQKEKKPKQESNKGIGFNSTSERFRPLKKSRSLSIETIEPEDNMRNRTTSNWIHKTFNSRFNNFGAVEPRFSNKAFNVFNITPLDTNIPGPGTYINPYSSTGTSNTVEYKGKLMSIKRAKELSKKKPDKTISLKVEDPIPPVGTYNPDIVTSINYSSLKKVTKSNPIPFESTIPKNTMLVKKDIIGPGSYIKEKEKVEKKQINPPFYTGAFRKDNIIPDSIGPGRYNMNIAYGWRKKEFNILYV